MNETTLDTNAVSHLPLRSDVFEVPIMSIVSTAVLGLVIIAGNFVTLLAIKLTPSLRSAPDLYLASLAVADLMVGFTTYLKIILSYGFSHENQLKTEAKLSKYVCLASISFGTIAFMASVSSLALLALDRCLSISYPLVYNSYAIKRRTRYVILGAWLCCVIYGLLPLAVNRFSSHKPCSTFTQLATWYVRFLSTGLILSSMTVSLLCYCKIGWVYHTYQRSIGAVRVRPLREQTCSQHIESTARYSGTGQGARRNTHSKDNELMSLGPYSKCPNQSQIATPYKYHFHLTSGDNQSYRFKFCTRSSVKRNFLQRAFRNNSRSPMTHNAERVSKSPCYNYSLMGKSQTMKREAGDQDQMMENEIAEIDKKRESMLFEELGHKKHSDFGDVFEDNFMANVCAHSTGMYPNVEKCGETTSFVDQRAESNCKENLKAPYDPSDCFIVGDQLFDSQNILLDNKRWDSIVAAGQRSSLTASIFSASDTTLDSRNDNHLRENVSKMSLPCIEAWKLRERTRAITRSKTLPSFSSSTEQDIIVKSTLSCDSPSYPGASCSNRRHDRLLINVTVDKDRVPPIRTGSCLWMFADQVKGSHCLRHSQYDLVSCINNSRNLKFTHNMPRPPQVLLFPTQSSLVDNCSDNFLQNSHSPIIHNKSNPKKEDIICPGLLKTALNNDTNRVRNEGSIGVRSVVRNCDRKDIKVIAQETTNVSLKPDWTSFKNNLNTQEKRELPSSKQAPTHLKTDSTDFHENFDLVRSEPKVNKHVLAKAMSHNSTRLIKMIFLTQVAFVLCVLPSMLVFLLNGLTYIPLWTMHVASFLAFINSGVNVFIYVVYNVKYRKAIWAVLRCTS